ncbi:MAG TPA: hypothetical protein EYP78_03005, partial [Candidatus Omnitrophica bacterium]|nr:hypothetical protein [Candidatus Omnitrophota bacterium]
RKSTHHPRTESLRLGEDAKKSLLNYRWPGNVRELENAVERALILTGENSQYLRASHFTLLGEQEKKQLNKDREVLPMEQLERKALSDALNTTGGNISEAARLLGISRDTMHRKIKKYRIKVAEFWRKMDTSG